MKRHASTLLIVCIALVSQAQIQVQTGIELKAKSKAFAASAIDTLAPDYLGDSCMVASTYYLLNDKIITGGAVLSNGSGIDKVAQLFDSGIDSIRIGSISVDLVYVDIDSGDGQIRASIYAEKDLQTAIGQSLPISTALLTDTSDVTSSNDFFFADPVKVKGKFWVVLDVVDGSDSIYVASTNDDCGGRSAIFQNNLTWLYYEEQFAIGNDPLDLALKMAVVMERIVSATEIESDNQRVSVFPTPSHEYVKVKLANPLLTADIKIFNSTGSLLLWQNNYQSENSIDLSALPPGFYFMNVQEKIQSYSTRLVVRP